MIAHRPYPTYADYVYQQGWKARVHRQHLVAHLAKGIENFEDLFRRAKTSLRQGAILCLGARTGAESIGATKAGFAGSVGIDLHPIGPTVIEADWHDLPFRDGSFANVYTNSLDHCLSLSRLAAEVRRVLRQGGRFYLMATNRDGATVESWLARGAHEALFWQTSDELCDAICACGFAVVKAWRTGKWGHYVLGVA